MTTRRRIALGALCALLSIAAWPRAASASPKVAVGDVVENAEMATLDGAREQLLSRKARASVIVFFRPRQAHSLATLQAMGACEQEFASKPVRFAAVVSSTWPAEEVRQLVAAAGIRMPVLLDRDDEVYGRIGVRLHPAVVVADGEQRLVAYEPYRRLNYCEQIRAKVRQALHEGGPADAQQTRAPMPSEAGSVSSRHVRMGEKFLQAKQYEKAARAARGVLEKEPGFAPAHVLLGDALAAEGKCEHAARSYAAALELDPGSEAAARGKLACTPR